MRVESIFSFNLNCNRLFMQDTWDRLQCFKRRHFILPLGTAFMSFYVLKCCLDIFRIDSGFSIFCHQRQNQPCAQNTSTKYSCFSKALHNGLTCMCASINGPTMARSRWAGLDALHTAPHSCANRSSIHAFSSVVCLSDRSGPTAAMESCNLTLDSGYHMLSSL